MTEQVVPDLIFRKNLNSNLYYCELSGKLLIYFSFSILIIIFKRTHIINRRKEVSFLLNCNYPT